MNINIVTDARFTCLPDGTVWTDTVFGATFWNRYLDAFDSVNVVARLRSSSAVPHNYVRSDSPLVSFSPVPHYIGPTSYLLRRREVSQAVRRGLDNSGAIVLRASSQLANLAFIEIRGQNRPFGIEVVGDPSDTFSRGSIKHPLRLYFRRVFSESLRQQCTTAISASYVTRSSLQERYPPGASTFATHYSSIELEDDSLVSSVPPLRHSKRIITVGTLEQRYKGVDVLIDAVAKSRPRHPDIHLVVVGGGRYQSDLEAQAKRLGIEAQVSFLGSLPPGKAIRDRLDQSDVFVLASRQEGLPRALIEAMARGLPCVATTVGGIPELLHPEDLVPPNNSAALAESLSQVLSSLERRSSMASRNLAAAEDYLVRKIAPRRQQMYGHLKQATEAWVQSRASGTKK